jgi:octaprenyl-diphosphate synthase
MRTLEKLDQQDGDFDHACRLLAEHDALADTQVRARGYAETARAALDIFPQGPHRTALEEVVDFCVERAY